MVKKKLTPHELGKAGEEAALRYLKRKRYKILDKGFRLFRGEIDIIARDKSTLVFVEVKTRSQEKFGLPEEAVTPAKQNQIRKIAEGFLVKNNMEDVECRFDVLSLIKTETSAFEIHHFKNAF